MAGTDVSALLRVPPGEAVDLAMLDPAATPGFTGGKTKARRQVAALGPLLAELQTRLHAAATAGASDRVLLVLQGTDCSGKDGVGRHVVSLLEPMWVQYAAFVRPTAEERRHDFLWRIRQHLPPAGEIGVFNRSHYEDVLIVAVHNLVPPRTWQKRYDAINRFEQRLAGDGVRFVKVMLQISPQEQLDRLRARLADPDKRWKYNPNDVDERHFYEQYVTATEAVLTHCNSPAAPWHLVPADHKWYRDWAVAHLLLDALREIGPKYPLPGFDLAAEQTRLDAEG